MQHNLLAYSHGNDGARVQHIQYILLHNMHAPPHISGRGMCMYTHSGTIKYIRPCWISCLLCLCLRYPKTLPAPGRCRRSPALRALELLPAIHTALEAAPMFAKELHHPR